MDRTLGEYEAARAELDAFVSAGSLMTVVRAATHLETCVDTMLRFVRLLDKLVRDNSTTLRRRDMLRDVDVQALTGLRNDIQHLEGFLASEWVQGEPAFLVPLTDRVYLHGSELTYDALSNLIERVHSIVTEVVADPERFARSSAVEGSARDRA